MHPLVNDLLIVHKLKMFTNNERPTS